MANFVASTSNLDAQELAALRRQKVAEMMMAQANQPVQPFQQAGRYVAPMHWSQGMAQLAQALVAARKGKSAEGELTGIADSRKKVADAAMQKFQAKSQGLPASISIGDVGGGPDIPLEQTYKADPEGAAIELAGRADVPEATRNAGMMQYQAGVRREEKSADRELRASEAEANRKAEMERIQEKLADAATAREDRERLELRLQQMSDDTRRDVASMAAATAANRYDRPRLKMGERYREDGTVEQIPGSAEYIKNSGLHADDFNALKTVDAKATQAAEKIAFILSPENEGAFNSNFGGYNAYATRLLPGNTQNVGLKVESLKSDLKNAGLEMMRAGGSVGQMTQQEWPIVQDMIDRIDPRLGEKEARDAFLNIKAKLDGIRNRAKTVYDTQWGDTQYHKSDAIAPPPAAPGAPAAPAAGGASDMSDEDLKKALGLP